VREQIAREALRVRRPRSCERKVRQPVKKWPRMFTPSSITSPTRNEGRTGSDEGTDYFPNPSSEQRSPELKTDSMPRLSPMSFAEILSEIPRLSFAERQEWVRSAIAVDDAELTAEENALLDARMEDFRRQPDAGIPLSHLTPPPAS